MNIVHLITHLLPWSIKSLLETIELWRNKSSFVWVHYFWCSNATKFRACNVSLLLKLVHKGIWGTSSYNNLNPCRCHNQHFKMKEIHQLLLDMVSCSIQDKPDRAQKNCSSSFLFLTRWQHRQRHSLIIQSNSSLSLTSFDPLD